MKHRIAAGVIVERDERFLLVRHHKPGVYDFWVAPGGGVEGDENLHEAARREVREECGLEVEPGEIAYIEEFTNPTTRECKVWFIGKLIGGKLNVAATEAVREYIVEAAWIRPDEFAGRTVFPAMLHAEYRIDKQCGFAFPRYMGVRRMEFY